MKASGNYAGAGGSVDVTRADYQERRKDTALGGGVIIAIIVVIAAIVWLFWDRVNAQLNGVGSLITAKQQEATQAILKGANTGTPTVSEARNNLGEYYPVKTLTQTDYDKMLEHVGTIPAAVVRLGNVVTPNEVLSIAASKGAEAANTVNTLGLNNAYWALPDVQRGLVTMGEGIGMAVGVDVIKSGYEFSRALENFSPFGSNIRTAVGSNKAPQNGVYN